MFRKMLNPVNWPDYDLIIEGELYGFVPSDDPKEERVYKSLFWRYE